MAHTAQIWDVEVDVQCDDRISQMPQLVRAEDEAQARERAIEAVMKQLRGRGRIVGVRSVQPVTQS
jgi:hypothetical protein